MTTHNEVAPVDAWPEPSKFKRDLRLEFSLYLSVLVILLMSVTGYVITEKYVGTVTRGIAERLLAQARSYTATAGKHFLGGKDPDLLMLSNVCSKLKQEVPAAYWAGITGTDSTFLAHSDVKQVMAGARLGSIQSTQYPDLVRPGEMFRVARDTIRITVPITEHGITLGYLGMASSAHQIYSARSNSIMTVASITLFMLLLGVPLTMFVLSRKLRPIRVIADALKKVDYDDIAIEIDVASEDELGYLAQTLRVMGGRLNVAQKDLIEKERIRRELELATEIQANILPRNFPASGQYDFAGAYRSAKEVGGDYYDFIEFGERYLGWLVADVSGKSLPGMLVMLLTRDIVKNLTRSLNSPKAVLSAVNKELLPNMKKGMFVTMFFGVLDTQTGEFTFASAGHNPLIKLSSLTGECELFKTKGFPLGMMPPAVFDKRLEESRLVLTDGDWLVQYTDGINEAQNAEQQEYGMDRFLQTVTAHAAQSPSELVEQTLSEHEAFTGDAPQYDDMTLVVMKWHGNSADTKLQGVCVNECSM